MIQPPPVRSGPIALTVAGSDSGGGAGIQADLKVFARHGVFGTSVITAVTAQNTRGVRAWEPVSLALVAAQLDAVLEDLPPAALKTGMLGTAATAEAVARTIAARAAAIPRVVDPVMVASSGDLLLDAGAISVIRDSLVPGAALVTPNLDEASVLLGRTVRTGADQREAARALVHALGAAAALVTGGHGTADTVLDVLYDGELHELVHRRIETRNTHGTGCTLSAAITALLARGETLRASVARGVAYVHRAIETAPGLGAGDGHGPVNHMV